KGIDPQVCLGCVDGTFGVAGKGEYRRVSPVGEIRIERQGSLELCHGSVRPCTEAQNISQLRMRLRQIGVQLDGFLSRFASVPERDRILIVAVKRESPS